MSETPITDVIGAIPYRMAFAGGWIDQPFVSEHNPDSPGSMVVVALEPTFWYMERAGMATGTRKVAMKLWTVMGKGDVNNTVKLHKSEVDGESVSKHFVKLINGSETDVN